MRLNLLSVGLMGCLLISPASAEDIERYRVELILFTQAMVQGDDEIWPPVEHQPALNEAQPLLLESALNPVSEETAQMGAILYTLERSSLYQPLLHTVWEQPGWPATDAQAVRIEIPFEANLPVTLFSENAELAVAEPAAISQVPELPAFMQRETIEDTPPAHLLSGTITIHRARYLHVDIDMIYREYIEVEVVRPLEPTAEEAAVGSEQVPVWEPLDQPMQQPTEVVETVTQLVEMPFQQKRRMRSKERHYIDHPRVGALIEITPIEQETPPDQAEPNKATPESN